MDIVRFQQFFYTLLIVLCCVTAFAKTTAAPNCVYQTQQNYYIWAAGGGVNLRAAPSDNAEVLKLLPYGTKVAVQAANHSKYPYLYKYARSVAGSGTDELVLSGCWVKVQANGQTGYVFSRFIQPFIPMRSDEGVFGYLERAFALKAVDKKVTRKKVDDYTEVETFKLFTSKDARVKLTLIETESEPEEKLWPAN